MADIFNIKFIDIDKNEKDAYQHLLFDIANLRARRDKNKELSEADLLELRRLKAVRDAGRRAGRKYFDPLFVAIRTALNSPDSPLRARCSRIARRPASSAYGLTALPAVVLASWMRQW